MKKFDLMKLNKLLLKVAENRFKNLKLECENLRTNMTLNRNELLNPSNPTERWKGKLKKFLTNLKKTKKLEPNPKLGR